MNRSSASGIAGLFENYPNFPRKKTKPGEFLLNTVFPRGHVREHDAIHYLNRCDGITEMRGQNGFARDYEYLEGDLERLYAQGKWLLKENRKKFNKLFVQELSKKIGNDAAAHIAFVEQSNLLLEEEEVGETFVEDFSELLASVEDVSSEKLFKEKIIAPALELAHSHFFADLGNSETGYYVNDIPYTLPRYTTNYGGLDLVCQPDGYCLANGIKTVVEIKSPMAGHYTSEATIANPEVRGQKTAKSSADRRKLWTKYLVQIAIEMDVTGAEQAIFLSWFDHTGKLILLDREIMDPLIAAVKEFAGELSADVQGSEATDIIAALRVIAPANAPRPAQKSSKGMTITALKAELMTLDWTDFTFGKKKEARTKKPYLAKLAELQLSTTVEEASEVGDNSYENVKSALATILDTLTADGDAWKPLEDTFSIAGLDILASALGELSVDSALFKTYVSQ